MVHMMTRMTHMTRMTRWLALCQDPAMQCFNYEIRIPAKQGFASSNIERLLSLPYEFWMKKQTSLESNQIESY